jgi:selenocysteine lyase/cysteine desulfurase
MCQTICNCKYLNYNSTDAKKSKSFNASDTPYPDVAEIREKIEELNNKILKLVNAPAFSHVIITSGSTESIATVVHWASVQFEYGTVCGSSYDHSAVKENCALYNLNYVQSLDDYKLIHGCNLVFVTHVAGKTGEVFNMDKFKTNILHGYTMGGNRLNDFNHNKFLINRPIIALDVAQSILKVPIDMERWGVNALFFSLHKLGGKPGLGVLVIADEAHRMKIDPNALVFVPLIAGSQQKGSRGGTYDFTGYLECERCFDFADDVSARREVWERAFNKFKDAGILIYEPKERHLYNTLLLSTKGYCPLSIINVLSEDYKIYVGNVSACANEKRVDFHVEPDGSVNMEVVKQIEKEDDEKYKQDPFYKAIRISWKYPDELNDKTIDNIIHVLKNSNGYREDKNE